MPPPKTAVLHAGAGSMDETAGLDPHLQLQAVASGGSAAVIALAKFGLGCREEDERIDALASKVSLSATILYAIAEKVEEQRDGFKKEEFWRVWRDVLQACNEAYSRVREAVKQAKHGRHQSGSTGNVSEWEQLVAVLGGDDQLVEVNANLRMCFQRVSAMHQTVQATALCLVAKRQQLSVKQVEEQKEIKRASSELLAALSTARIMSEKTPTNKSLTTTQDKQDQAMGESPQCRFGEGDNAASKSSPKRPASSHSSSDSSPPSSTTSSLDHHFEAYYIVPRTVSIPSSRGMIQVTKAQTDEYMILSTDISRPNSDNTEPRIQDRNVRRALRRAGQVSSSKVTFLDTATFPQKVHEAMSWLVKTRNDHASAEEWKLVDAIELSCVEESEGMFRKKQPVKSGYLVLLRGRELSTLEIEKSQARKKRRRASSDASSQSNPTTPRKRKHRRRHSDGTDTERTKARRKTRSPGLFSRRLASTHNLPLRTAPARVPARSSLRKSGPQCVESWPPTSIQPTAKHDLAYTSFQAKEPQHVGAMQDAHPVIPGLNEGHPVSYASDATTEARRKFDGSGSDGMGDEAWMKIHNLMASFADV